MERLSTCTEEGFHLNSTQSELIKLLINTALKSIGSHLQKHTKERESWSDVNFIFVIEVTLNLLISLVEKYPLLIEQLLQIEIPLETIKKIINVPEVVDDLHKRFKGNSLTFLDIMDAFSYLTPNSFRCFYVSLVEKNYKFYKDSSGLICQSTAFWRKKFLREIRERIDSLSLAENFLEDRLSIYQFKDRLHLLINILKTRTDTLVGTQTRDEYLVWFNFLCSIVERVKLERSGALLYSNFFDILNYVYKFIIRVNFLEACGHDDDDDSELAHKIYLKFYLNKRLLSYFNQTNIEKNMKFSEEESLKAFSYEKDSIQPPEKKTPELKQEFLKLHSDLLPGGEGQGASLENSREKIIYI